MDPRVLLSHGDDAGVYLLSDNLALVQTVDFFTPIVDSPEGFGAIAVANALSDVYAMGARPLTALNIVGFPAKGQLPMEILGRILKGGYDKAAEAGVAILGGHTVDDPEPKYGLAVTGVAEPDQLFSLDATEAGDLLVLTKPLGTGILATALKGGLAPEGSEEMLIKICAHLNRRAADIAREVDAHGVTDVTGFGLTLHAADLAEGSKLGLELWADRLPLMAGVRECMAQGLIPGGTRANLAHATERGLVVDASVSEDDLLLANDAQTSGGLLIAVSPKSLGSLVEALTRAGEPAAAVVGRLTTRPGLRVTTTEHAADTGDCDCDCDDGSCSADH